MIEIKPYLRRAYLQKLANLTYLGVGIPVDDENLTKPAANLNIGNAMGVQAWVLIQNQTVQDNSAKCSINQASQLQLAVTTWFPNGGGSNSGNYAHADFISDAILQILFPYPTNQAGLELSNAQLWKASFFSSVHRFEEHAEGRFYSNIIILDHGIKQYNLST